MLSKDIHTDKELSTNASKNMTALKLRIAIDGPAGAGKSSVSRQVADSLGYLYIDTGAMYRAATWLILQNNIPLEREAEIANLLKSSTIALIPAHPNSREKLHVLVDRRDITEEIRGQMVTNTVSAVSAMVPVRQILMEKQRALAKAGNVVLDGRDIGTVVLPDAELKIFLTASKEIRAQRRHEELVKAGQNVSYETVLHELNERDYKDSTRDIAPFKQAQDAVMILTDFLSIEQVVQCIVELAQGSAKD